jgi:formyltetrahydrofolate deformylase
MALEPTSSTPACSSQVLLVDCLDERGLIFRITDVLLQQNANIIANHEFADGETGRFVMRTEFTGASAPDTLVDALRARLPALANVRVSQPNRHRIAVLATKEYHCLAELLLLHAHGELGASIEMVVSNHAHLAPLVGRFGIPFHHVPHDGLTRAEHESRIARLLEGQPLDYLVLAKFMRVLSKEFIDRYPSRIVNIHHSFLPAFTGSNPYRQAFERGVKIIGATAHFVTEGLDEGPIIAQAVVPIDHSWRPNEMARAGRDVEKMVLARALKLVCEDRVFLIGNRTIVFD